MSLSFLADYDFKMMTQFDGSEPANTSDLFDNLNDFTDPLDNSQQTPITQQQNPYQQQVQQPQQRANYITQPRQQLSSYQTPNLQRIPTIPTSAIVRSPNVISNGIQQQPTIYTSQQIMNTSRTAYPRIPVPSQQQQPQQIQQPQQTMASALVRQQYNQSSMVPMNQNVTQMNIVKASDPNNNSVYVPNSQQQQPSTLVGLQSPHTVTQGNKPISTGLPSLTSQQLIHIQQQQQQQQSSLQSFNIRV